MSRGYVKGTIIKGILENERVEIDVVNRYFLWNHHERVMQLN